MWVGCWIGFSPTLDSRSPVCYDVCMEEAITYVAIDQSGASPHTLGSILAAGPNLQEIMERADARRQHFADPENAPVGVYALQEIR